MFRDTLIYNNPFIGIPTFNPAFEVPRGSGLHSIITGALWIGGKDNLNNLYVAAQTYRQIFPSSRPRAQAGFWPGPIGTTLAPLHSSKYDKVWKVSKTQVDNHKVLYAQSSYNIPADIATWPGNGNTANGEAAMLAPFIDVNSDGIYSPVQGDYPDIKGDQALYVILNDKGNIKEPVSASMNTEIHVLFYGFDNQANSPVYNTLFSEYRIINRGANNLHDFYAGLWVDFDLGNWNDDFIGCDTLNNRFFVYNGDNFDEDSVYMNWGGPPTLVSSVKGYGLNPPVQSVAFLDKKLNHFMYYTNDMNPTNGNPITANDYYNYLRGIWKDNKILTYGGDGTNQANLPAAHMFTGNPVNLSGWSELNTLTSPNLPNFPSDRRGIGSIGPFNINAGQELKFTVAYTYSRGTSNLNSVTQSHTDAIAVQNFFRNQVMGAPKPAISNGGLQLFPNPAQDRLNIQFPATFLNQPVTISITDYTGRTILQKSLKAEVNLQQLDISKLSKGIYQVSVTSENQTITSRLVKL